MFRKNGLWYPQNITNTTYPLFLYSSIPFPFFGRNITLSHSELERERQEGADSVLQGIVLKFISSQSDGASVQDAVKHCLGLGAASDALVVQRVVDQLAADVQIYCDDKNRMRPL